MLGFGMRVELDGIDIELCAPTTELLVHVVGGMQSLNILMYTAQVSAKSLEDERAWFEKVRTEQESMVWFIRPAGSDIPIGVTALHNIDNLGTCTSGIMIWDKTWWRKGIATRAHLARTLYAADYLNRSVIHSSARTENPGSVKALQRAGYTLWGTEVCSGYRKGEWLETAHLTWLHPDRTGMLFPKGVPELYREGIEKAKIELNLARQVVALL